ncbi:MAG TPA: hypothetical protein EYG74_02910 [Sulfurimonas autotrophica]|nr:hypothetical protein [Sulfurimonas autotrophica]
MLKKPIDTFRRVLFQRGLTFKSKNLKKIDFSKFEDILNDQNIYHEGNPNDFHIQYFEYYITHSHFFKYINSKENASLLYTKIQQASYKDNDEYRGEVNRISTDIESNMRLRNEQLHALSLEGREKEKRKSRKGRELLIAHNLSVVVLYNDRTMGILRFKLIKENTSYTDLGKLSTLLSFFSYNAFCQEHNITPKAELDTFYHHQKEVKETLTNLFKRLQDIEKIILFREPGPGRVFQKREYQYSANFFYMYTMHTKDGIDITRTSLIDSDLKDYDDLLLTEYLTNTHDKYITKVAYLNFIELYMHLETFDNLIDEEIYEEVMEFINEYYYETVTDQQCRMYMMIKNKIKDAYTKNITSCHLIKQKFAEKKRNEEIDIQKKYYIQKWINTLEDKPKRIEPGSELLYNMSSCSNPYDEYIIDQFASSIPWFNWHYTVVYAHKSLKNILGDSLYNKHKTNLSILINKVFGKNGFLYGNEKYSRGVFYEEIVIQFDAYGKWEKKERKKRKNKQKEQTNKEVTEVTIDDILKDSVFKKIKNIAEEKGFLDT